MFGGWGISTDGLTLAIIADLGAGERLYLKASEETRGRYEAAGCLRFVYEAKGRAMSMNYYSAPEEALESPALMQPWARLALECALKAGLPSTPRSRRATRSIANSKPAGSRLSKPPGQPDPGARRRAQGHNGRAGRQTQVQGRLSHCGRPGRRRHGRLPVDRGIPLAIAQNRLQHHPLSGRDRQPGTGLQEQITRAAFVRPIQCDPDAALPDPQHTRHLGAQSGGLAAGQRPETGWLVRRGHQGLQGFGRGLHGDLRLRVSGINDRFAFIDSPMKTRQPIDSIDASINNVWRTPDMQHSQTHLRSRPISCRPSARLRGRGAAPELPRRVGEKWR
jgi:DNA transformation protein